LPVEIATCETIKAVECTWCRGRHWKKRGYPGAISKLRSDFDWSGFSESMTATGNSTPNVTLPKDMTNEELLSADLSAPRITLAMPGSEYYRNEGHGRRNGTQSNSITISRLLCSLANWTKEVSEAGVLPPVEMWTRKTSLRSMHDPRVNTLVQPHPFSVMRRQKIAMREKLVAEMAVKVTSKDSIR
jgi:hypothetical protein